MVFPTILGRGRRVFPDGIDRLKFKLTDSRTVGTDGVQVQVYERDRVTTLSLPAVSRGLSPRHAPTSHAPSGRLKDEDARRQ